MIALVDCNNFYVSCERIFRPDLRHKPVMVLSNNDGCVVARSQEVKSLGIKMGVPLFKVRHLIKKHNIQVFSSNYALYGDISNRVMLTLGGLVPNIEVYSIDEAFLDIDVAVNLTKYGFLIQNTIKKHIGIPVCVGIAPTKTLAKLATEGAKKYTATGGVVDLSEKQRQQRLLKIMPIDKIWGVGKRLTNKLNSIGIYSAWELSKCDTSFIRKKFSVVLERTVHELNGQQCLELEDIKPANQQIIVSRSFANRITCQTQLWQLISGYISRATEKMRKQSLKCAQITVFIRTGGFNQNQAQYKNSAYSLLVNPSSDTRLLLNQGQKLFNSIWRKGYRYAKAGVILNAMSPANTMQLDLFSDNENYKENNKSQKLMQTIDALNLCDSGQIYFASQGKKKPFDMRQENLSPCYTTNWNDILQV